MLQERITHEVDLTEVTENGEKLMITIARVSSPDPDNPKYARLLRYCIKKRHWSVFEHAHMTVEITTSRGISPQILRHRSFTFQEFSQRYAAVDDSGVIIYAARRKAEKNRQSSVDDLPQEVIDEWDRRQMEVWRHNFEHYQWALDNDIATECARFVLPAGTKTRLYMTGNARSWIHYIQLRTQPDVQEEHRDIAIAIRTVFATYFPHIAEAMGWNE